MKNSILLLITALTLMASSCNKEEASEERTTALSTKLIGEWKYDKEYFVSCSDEVIQENSLDTCESSLDRIVFSADGKFENHVVYECSESSTYTGTWEWTGENSIIATYDVKGTVKKEDYINIMMLDDNTFREGEVSCVTSDHRYYYVTLKRVK